jgi:hypothetical protein
MGILGRGDQDFHRYDREVISAALSAERDYSTCDKIRMSGR